MNTDISYIRELFMHLYNIDGAKELVHFLFRESDYLTAPASSKYHSSYEGGLVDHSVRVTENLLKLTEKFNIKWDRPESPYIIGLLHDFCKVSFYKSSLRNVKNNETGKWEQVPYYEIDEALPLGHGAKSVILIQRYIKLTIQEIFCILYHMGAYGLSSSEEQNLSKAMRKCPEIVYTALADEVSGIEEDTNLILL